MGLVVLVSLLIVVADLTLVAMFVLHWERRAGPPVPDHSRQPAEVRAGRR